MKKISGVYVSILTKLEDGVNDLNVAKFLFILFVELRNMNYEDYI